MQWPPLRRIVLLVQAEFGRRLLARPGNAKYGRLSVLVSTLCTSCEMVHGSVLPEAFSPAPRVDSVVVLLEPDAKACAGLPLNTLDQLLHLMLDGARGRARGMGAQAALATHARALGWEESRWREAEARAGLGTMPVFQLEPQAFLNLARELEAAGCHFSRGPAERNSGGALVKSPDTVVEEVV